MALIALLAFTTPPRTLLAAAADPAPAAPQGVAPEAPLSSPLPLPVQDPPQPAEPPAGTLGVSFVGDDTIRRADGRVVVYYRVNFIDAEVLRTELSKWVAGAGDASKSVAAGSVEVMGPTVVPATFSPSDSKSKAPFHTAKNIIRIECAETAWPEIKRILDVIDVPDPQVKVDCKIVEVRHDSSFRMGIDATITRPVGDTFFRKLEAHFLSPSVSGVADIVTQRNEKFLTFDYVLHLASTGAVARVNAMPSVMATQGEVATIKLVEREPIVEQNSTGTTLFVATRFQDIGLNLDVQPLFVGRNFVRARVSAELSRISGFRSTSTSSNTTITNPVISTRSATTMVTVPDGETLVLAGLESTESTDQQTGLPILRDLPLIGPVFGSTTKSDGQTELIFYITFTIEKPGDSSIVLPTGEALPAFDLGRGD